MFIILFIVGSIFTLIGLLFFKKYSYYKKHGNMIRGSVIGIEEYTSRSGSNNSRSTYYAPIIEFPFEGKSYLFKDGGSSNGLSKYKIGQSVKLLSHPKGPEYIFLPGGVNNIFAYAFTLMGLGALGFGFYNLYKSVTNPKGFQLDLFDIVPLVMMVFAGVSICLKAKKAKSKLKKKSIDFDFNKEKLFSREDLKDKKVFYTNHEIKAINQKHEGIAFIISVVYFILISTLLMFFWGEQTLDFKDKVLAILFDINRWPEFINFFTPRMNRHFFGLVIILFFFLVGVLSLYSSLKRKLRN
tara:strand:- start:7585 stop:8478 length:894 start_codon:yes stop_codon:yes gene_type:complete